MDIGLKNAGVSCFICCNGLPSVALLKLGAALRELIDYDGTFCLCCVGHFWLLFTNTPKPNLFAPFHTTVLMLSAGVPGRHVWCGVCVRVGPGLACCGAEQHNDGHVHRPICHVWLHRPQGGYKQQARLCRGCRFSRVLAIACFAGQLCCDSWAWGRLHISAPQSHQHALL